MMKAISEYFRDLAQEDRYFGAEPPTPDAEMLARIAEREVARRVDARLENGGVVLRPSLGQAAAAATAAAPAAAQDDAPKTTPATQESQNTEAAPDDLPVEADPDIAAVQESDEADIQADETPEANGIAAIAESVIDTEEELIDASALEDIVAPKAETARPALTDPSSVAAKLSRIRAVVESNEHREEDIADDFTEDQHAEAFETEEHLTFDDLIDEDFEDELAPAAEIKEDVQDEEFDADAMARIMADQDEPEAIADAPEAEVSLDDDEDDDGMLADTLASVLADQDSLDDDDEIDASDELNAEEAELDGEFEDEAPKKQLIRSRARVVRVKRAAFDAAVAAGVVEAADDAENDDAQEVAQSVTPDIESSLSDEDEEALTRELANLEDEFVADDDEEDDFDAALASAFEDDDDLEDEDEPQELAQDEDEFDDEDEVAEDKSVDAFFDDQDEDDDDDDDEVSMFAEEDDEDEDDEFSRELEDVFSDENFEDDLEDLEPSMVAEPEIEVDLSEAVSDVRRAVKMSSPGRALLTEGKVGEDGSSVSRILDETNQQLDEPEGNRRRNAIAHLRAAVAATRADRILGGKSKAKEEADPYREDLATVVRPRRPQATAQTPRPTRPDQNKPAPLKLVAEQRIDRPEDAAPIRPRRVSRKVEDVAQPASNDEGFAEYAERVGATDLAEMLEAAAAYMSFVEGQDAFSRPQLMAKMREADATDYSREDRLRSFGTLLREGKIAKLEGGKFAVSDNIGFQPKARAAG
ncbi:MAG: hypothetical protein JJ877_17345 [Thalassococcus sp.]|uniref:hypothetical protein n=1 Tax=Thalassococcus sp. TaxID=1928858 RepID=UPI001B0ADC72|nr:hypothetical protein [Thalassococcus sp.]MBO6868808.1 hypothetical protein [Thalassococcus sp.]